MDQWCDTMEQREERYNEERFGSGKHHVKSEAMQAVIV